jgi:DNA-binding NarL/FixJ family response regulator
MVSETRDGHSRRIHEQRSEAGAIRHSGISAIQVLVVDDHPPLRYGIRRLIDEQPDLVTIGEAEGGPEAISKFGRWVDVAVVDYHLDGRDGLWLTRQIKQRPSPPPVLIYSAFANAMLTIASIVAGADGLLSKAALAEELPIAIRRVFRDRKHFPAPPQTITAALRSRLDRRDQAIFSMLLHGIAPSEISSRLDMTPPQLEARREGILGVIAPGVERSTAPVAAHAPLDYQRTRRRSRYPAGG